MRSKYIQIYEDLARQIKDQTLKANSFLPSEHQLEKIYQTSRSTVRKALERLKERGFIRSIHGKGWMVHNLERFPFPVYGLQSFKELSTYLGVNTKTDVLINEEIDQLPFSLKDLPDHLTGFSHIVRLRYMDESPAVVDVDYLFHPIAPKVPTEVLKDSLYAFLENEKHLPIHSACKDITVEEAPSDVSDLIHSDLVVVVRSTVYLEDDTPFQYTISYHHPDKFRFTDISMRRK